MTLLTNIINSIVIVYKCYFLKCFITSYNGKTKLINQNCTRKHCTLIQTIGISDSESDRLFVLLVKHSPDR